MKTILITLLLAFSTMSYAQTNGIYPNIANYNITGTPVYGIKIKTNIPNVSGNHTMVNLTIDGYDYARDLTRRLNLVCYVYDGKILHTSASSFGGATPPIILSNENGKLSIFINDKTAYQRFTVSASAETGNYAGLPSYFAGWTVVDENLAGTNQTKVPYINNFGGDIGVNGSITMGSIDGTLHPKLRILGPNSPSGVAYCRDISFDFNSAGSSIIRAYRGGSWDNYFDFLTTYQNEIPLVRMHIHANGNIGIGTTSPNYKLDVNGTVHAKEVKIEATGWADYVFDKDYSLPSLKKVEEQIHENKHLEGIPSEEEVKNKGIDVVEMQKKLLQKIEELTLYTIEQENRIKALEKKVNNKRP